MKVLAIAVVFAAALSAGSASADDRSFYLRATVGSTHIGNEGGSLDDATASGYGINMGWRFLPWLAVEAGAHRLGTFSNSVAEPFSGASGWYSPRKLDNVELGLLARAPITDSKAFLQARAGVHHWGFENNKSGTDPYYGVGIGYAFETHWNLSLNYDRYQGSDWSLAYDHFNANRTSLGIEWSF